MNSLFPLLAGISFMVVGPAMVVFRSRLAANLRIARATTGLGSSSSPYVVALGSLIFVVGLLMIYFDYGISSSSHIQGNDHSIFTRLGVPESAILIIEIISLGAGSILFWGGVGVFRNLIVGRTRRDSRPRRMRYILAVSVASCLIASALIVVYFAISSLIGAVPLVAQ